MPFQYYQALQGPCQIVDQEKESNFQCHIKDSPILYVEFRETEIAAMPIKKAFYFDAY